MTPRSHILVGRKRRTAMSTTLPRAPAMVPASSTPSVPPGLNAGGRDVAKANTRMTSRPPAPRKSVPVAAPSRMVITGRRSQAIVGVKHLK